MLVLSIVSLETAAAMPGGPDTVKFPSAEAATELTGFLYRPDGAGPFPAVIMLHGRSGAYSSRSRGTYTAETLSLRHRMWGEFWRDRGYVVLLVDSFGPRGYPEGFPRHSYAQRPAAVSERDVRPADAYAGLRFLAQRSDVDRQRIGVFGWSNGAMTLLHALGRDLSGDGALPGFRAGIALYPGCRAQLREAGYTLRAPLLLLIAGDDEEVAPEPCRELGDTLRERGAPIEFVVYPGAHHAYDDPGKTRQSHPPNRQALEDTLRRAESFFAKHLSGTHGPRGR